MGEYIKIEVFEIYPTNIHGIGTGFISALTCLGTITTPYIAQVLFQASDYAAIGLYTGSCLVRVLVSLQKLTITFKVIGTSDS